MIPPFSPENHMMFPKSLTSLPPLYYPLTLCWQWLITLPLLPENHMIPSKCSTPSPPLYYPFTLCWQWLITLPLPPENHMIPPNSPTPSPLSILPLYTLLVMTDHLSNPPWKPYDSSKFPHPLPPFYITPLHSVGNDWSPLQSPLK